MKIALVISALGAGGAERVIITLANEWAARGRAVTLLSFEPAGTRPYYALDSRVTLRQLNVVTRQRRFGAIRQSLKRVIALRRALRAVQPDVVISFLAKINIVTLLATRGLDLGVVISDHNNLERQAASPVWRLLRRRLYGAADRLVAPSGGVLNTMPTAADGRGHVIPNPVDLPPLSPRPTNSRTLVAVGRLTQQKGFDLLLPAFARIAGDHPDWRLVIWGEGEERAALEALRDRLGLAERISLPGLTGRSGQWVEDATLFVLSSRFEGFGVVITEAMAAGVPVIATDCPWGPGEIIQHEVDGWLVAPEDVAALASGLDRLMADETLRAQLAEVARRNVRRFGCESVMAMWDDLIAELAGRRSSAAGSGPRAPEFRDSLSVMPARTPRQRGLFAKRALDVVAALAGLLLAAPILLAIALAVRIGLGKPVLFRQMRPGLGGRPFALLKFRTMTDARDEAGELRPDAQRMTALGRCLRRTSLDELPELINVLKGEMSLVGPRPLLMEYLPHYTSEQARRHEVRPGLTGWAAVHGRNATTWPERLARDVWYVDHRSFALDCKILLMTVGKVIRQEGISPEGQVTMPRFDEEFCKKV